MKETQGSIPISTKLQRIAKLAKDKQGEALTTLSHHIDIEWLRESYRRTRKDGAAGVDGQTAEAYAVNLEENLRSLLDRAKSGERYHAPPVRRVHIPKGDGGKTRPIGIPTFEDKILQRAVAMVLEAVYEQEFFDSSYGFRPGRSAHQALEALQNGLMSMGGGWVLEVDIEAYFDSIDKSKLQEIIRQRVCDGVLLRLLGKWLNAGVLEDGSIYHPETGTPQGGVVSPILSNIYLHEILDKWFETQVKPRMKGRVMLIRFADDLVVVCQREDDVRRIEAVLPKRFGKYGLRLHPTKTRLVNFQRPRGKKPSKATNAGPESFDLLGFTHYWGLSRNGYWVVKRKTMKNRLSRTLRAIADWCRKNRHKSIKEQHKILVQKLKGHDAYYGISGNFAALAVLRMWVTKIWHKWLSRRSRKAYLVWEQMQKLMKAYPLPKARIVHPYQPRTANP